MKTKTNKNHPLGACGTDTHQRSLYEVTVARTDYLYTKVRVEADSQEDAEAEAESIADNLPDQKWEVADRELYVNETEQLTEGGRHE